MIAGADRTVTPRIDTTWISGLETAASIASMAHLQARGNDPAPQPLNV
jgi:hypothetical protein